MGSGKLSDPACWANKKIQIRFCCKNSLPNAEGVEDGVLLSLGCHSKQGGDEEHLTSDVSFCYPFHLSFPHHVHHLISLQGSPSGLTGEKAQSRISEAFDQAMILRGCDY